MVCDKDSETVKAELKERLNPAISGTWSVTKQQKELTAKKLLSLNPAISGTWSVTFVVNLN